MDYYARSNCDNTSIVDIHQYDSSLIAVILGAFFVPYIESNSVQRGMMVTKIIDAFERSNLSIESYTDIAAVFSMGIKINDDVIGLPQSGEYVTITKSNSKYTLQGMVNKNNITTVQIAVQVVHLKIKNGTIVQNCDVYIGRAWNMGGWKLNQSIWHNPFSAKQYGRDECINKYEHYIRSKPELLNQLKTLRGKVLGCWCHPLKCHGDVLARLVNELC